MAVPSIHELIAKGMGRSMSVGAFSTGIVGGGAGTVLDLDQPEFVVGVPSGYCIRLIRVEINVHPGIEIADSDEVDVLVGVDVMGLAQLLSAETCTIENPINMRTDLGNGSMCRTASAVTANIATITAVGTSAAPVLDLELARVVQTTNFGDATGISHRIVRLEYQPEYPLFLVGPCTVLGYWGGTIANVGGFAVVQWVEGRPDELGLVAI